MVGIIHLLYDFNHNRGDFDELKYYYGFNMKIHEFINSIILFLICNICANKQVENHNGIDC